MAKGTIRRLIDRGFGFIQTAEGTDLFFHRNELEGVEFNSLSEGQEVEFEKSQGRDGRPQAVKVRLAGAEVKEEPPSAEETASVREIQGLTTKVTKTKSVKARPAKMKATKAKVAKSESKTVKSTKVKGIKAKAIKPKAVKASTRKAKTPKTKTTKPKSAKTKK